jgi:hypothetical protein
METGRIPDCTRLRIFGTVMKSENNTVQQYDFQTGPKIDPIQPGHIWRTEIPLSTTVYNYIYTTYCARDLAAIARRLRWARGKIDLVLHRAAHRAMLARWLGLDCACMSSDGNAAPVQASDASVVRP